MEFNPIRSNEVDHPARRGGGLHPAGLRDAVPGGMAGERAAKYGLAGMAGGKVEHRLFQAPAGSHRDEIRSRPRPRRQARRRPFPYRRHAACDAGASAGIPGRHGRSGKIILIFD